jgi:hypothetical protein
VEIHELFDKVDLLPFCAGTTEHRQSFLLIFTVLGYSPMGVKFPPTTAPRTLYTVKEKIGKFWKLFSF